MSHSTELDLITRLNIAHDNLSAESSWNDAALTCDEAGKEIESLRAKLAEAESRLPETMKDCTILFFECEKGHGRLTATNWIQHGCYFCRIAELEAQLAGCIVKLNEIADSLPVEWPSRAEAIHEFLASIPQSAKAHRNSGS